MDLTSNSEIDHANHVDRLEAEIVRLTSERDALKRECAELAANLRTALGYQERDRAEIERLRTENENLRRWKALDKPLTAAMAIANCHVARLRAALKPFAYIAEDYANSDAQREKRHRDEGRTWKPREDSHRVSIGLGDCRAALAAVNEQIATVKDGGGTTAVPEGSSEPQSHSALDPSKFLEQGDISDRLSNFDEWGNRIRDRN